MSDTLVHGVSHEDVAVQLGRTDGGALVMSTYGHPSEDLARERLKRAYATNVVRLQVGEVGLQQGAASHDLRSAIGDEFAPFEAFASIVASQETLAG